MKQDSNSSQASPGPGAVAPTPTETDFELRVDGFQGSPEEVERQWYEQV